MHVLLGLGPGDLWNRALEETVTRAREAGDDLTVAVFGEQSEREEITERARERLRESDFAVDVRQIEAERPGSALVDLAEQEQYDRLVIPGGQRSPLGKIQFDDVTEFVLLNAATTVTLVR